MNKAYVGVLVLCAALLALSACKAPKKADYPGIAEPSHIPEKERVLYTSFEEYASHMHT